MLITKDQMARDLVDKTGYYLKDIKKLLSAMGSHAFVSCSYGIRSKCSYLF